MVLMMMLLMAALAEPYTPLAPALTDWHPSPDTYEQRLEIAAGQAPLGTTHIELFATGPDGVRRPYSSYLPVLPAPVQKDRPAPTGPPADVAGSTQGGLSGRAVYLSQCHGWIYFETLNAFSTQRGNLFDTVEDFHNPEGMNQYLIPMLENAGANLFTVKERDNNPLMSIVDNGGEGYVEDGSGFEDGHAGFAPNGPWEYGENPFDAGGTRRFPADNGGRVVWTPEVPRDGQYVVYVSWESDPENSETAHYRIHHPGGVIDRLFDQTVHGSTWQYVERLWLPEGIGGLTVELMGDATTPGRWLSADAVRIGGGFSDVIRQGNVSLRPRWEEGAIQYAQFNGAPSAVYDPWGDGDGSDPTVRALWAAWEHPASEDAIYLSWHSNAGGGEGTSTYYYSGSKAPVEGSAELASLVQEEVVSMARSLWDPDWRDRGVKTAGFAEVNPYYNPEMPSALLELAFHDSAYDVEYLLEPQFREDTSRALYRAIVRYFAERDGTTPVFLPEPPEGLALIQVEPGLMELSFREGLVGDPFGDAPTHYRLYTSTDGYSWDNGMDIAGRTHRIEMFDNLRFFRVVAVNEGGVSFPSETVAGRSTADPQQPVLMVAAFDRQESSLLPWEDVGRSIGHVVRMDLGRMNTFNILSPHALAFESLGWGFDSLSDERLSEVDLSGYSVIIWATGEESTFDETFSDAQQEMIRRHVEAGGALFVSGAEVLWDLDTRGAASDQAFADEVLGAQLASDDSETTVVDGVGLLEGLVLDFGEADGAPYPVEYPDVLSSSGEPLALYADGGLAGALTGSVALFGFPFETIGDGQTRIDVMSAVLSALHPNYVVPEWPDEPEEPVGGCACDSGVGSLSLGWGIVIFGLYRRRRGRSTS